MPFLVYRKRNVPQKAVKTKEFIIQTLQKEKLVFHLKVNIVVLLLCTRGAKIMQNISNL